MSLYIKDIIIMHETKKWICLSYFKVNKDKLIKYLEQSLPTLCALSSSTSKEEGYIL